MMRNNMYKAENYTAFEIEPNNSTYGRGVILRLEHVVAHHHVLRAMLDDGRRVHDVGLEDRPVETIAFVNEPIAFAERANRQLAFAQRIVGDVRVIAFVNRDGAFGDGVAG